MGYVELIVGMALLIVVLSVYVTFRDRRRGGGLADRKAMTDAEVTRAQTRAMSESAELHNHHG